MFTSPKTYIVLMQFIVFITKVRSMFFRTVCEIDRLSGYTRRVATAQKEQREQRIWICAGNLAKIIQNKFLFRNLSPTEGKF